MDVNHLFNVDDFTFDKLCAETDHLTKTGLQEHIYHHPWELVVFAYYRRYPVHPRVPLMLGGSIELDEWDAAQQVRKIVRKVRIAVELPGWLKKTVGLSELVFVQTTIINAKKKSMVIHNVNETWKGKLCIGDDCEYQSLPPEEGKTQPRTYFTQKAFFQLPKLPMVKKIEGLMVKSYDKNTGEGRLLDELFVEDALKAGYSEKIATQPLPDIIRRIALNGKPLKKTPSQHARKSAASPVPTTAALSNGGNEMGQAAPSETTESDAEEPTLPLPEPEAEDAVSRSIGFVMEHAVALGAGLLAIFFAVLSHRFHLFLSPAFSTLLSIVTTVGLLYLHMWLFGAAFWRAVLPFELASNEGKRRARTVSDRSVLAEAPVKPVVKAADNAKPANGVTTGFVPSSAMRFQHHHSLHKRSSSSPEATVVTGLATTSNPTTSSAMTAALAASQLPTAPSPLTNGAVSSQSASPSHPTPGMYADDELINVEEEDEESFGIQSSAGDEVSGSPEAEESSDAESEEELNDNEELREALYDPDIEADDPEMEIFLRGGISDLKVTVSSWIDRSLTGAGILFVIVTKSPNGAIRSTERSYADFLQFRKYLAKVLPQGKVTIGNTRIPKRKKSNEFAVALALDDRRLVLQKYLNQLLIDEVVNKSAQKSVLGFLTRHWDVPTGTKAINHAKKLFSNASASAMEMGAGTDVKQDILTKARWSTSWKEVMVSLDRNKAVFNIFCRIPYIKGPHCVVQLADVEEVRPIFGSLKEFGVATAQTFEIIMTNRDAYYFTCKTAQQCEDWLSELSALKQKQSMPTSSRANTPDPAEPLSSSPPTSSAPITINTAGHSASSPAPLTPSTSFKRMSVLKSRLTRRNDDMLHRALFGGGNTATQPASSSTVVPSSTAPVKSARIIMNRKRIKFYKSAEDPNACDLAKVLLMEMLSIFADFVHARHTYTDAIYDRLNHYAEKACTLQSVKLEELSTQAARLSFFLNVYHALLIQSTLEFRVNPTESMKRRQFMYSSACYEIGGLLFSLKEIDLYILKAKMTKSTYLRNTLKYGNHNFSKTDSRKQWQLDMPDPRIIFVLNYGVKSSVYNVWVFSADPTILSQELDHASTHFLNEQIYVDTEKGVIHLPRICQWHSADLGGNRTRMLRTLLPYMPNAMESDIRRLLKATTLTSPTGQPPLASSPISLQSTVHHPPGTPSISPTNGFIVNSGAAASSGKVKVRYTSFDNTLRGVFLAGHDILSANACLLTRKGLRRDLTLSKSTQQPASNLTASLQHYHSLPRPQGETAVLASPSSHVTASSMRTMEGSQSLPSSPMSAVAQTMQRRSEEEPAPRPL